MRNENIHPIYLQNFVGTWKRPTSADEPGNEEGLLTFKRDFTYTELIGSGGTVNGDVDEVSVTGDGMPENARKVTGDISLSQGPRRYQWHFSLEYNHDLKIQNNPGPNDKPGAHSYNQLILSMKGISKLYILESTSPDFDSKKESVKSSS